MAAKLVGTTIDPRLIWLRQKAEKLAETYRRKKLSQLSAFYEGQVEAINECLNILVTPKEE